MRKMYEMITDVYKFIKQNPGCAKSVLSHQCRLSMYTTDDILRALEDAQMVKRLRLKGRWGFIAEEQ